MPVTIFDPAFQQSALNLLVALLLGSLIGFERQWRQRMAGLRTNTLVSLGAAIFVVFASQFSDTSPTRVAAQVVEPVPTAAALALRAKFGFGHVDFLQVGKAARLSVPNAPVNR